MGQTNAGKFFKSLGGKFVRPQTATPGSMTFDNGAVTLGQTKSYLDGKSVGLAVRAAAIAAFKDDVSVDAD